jgi:hypothetical protein
MEETKDDERIEYKIYQIVCNETDEVYFGKTIQTLSKRLKQHRENGHSYTSKQIILRGDYYIEQIDSTFDEIESIILERYYIETFECVNERIPGKSKKEWREENKEEIREKKKEYRELNKDEISEKRKETYTCECGSTLRKNDKARHERSYTHIYFMNNGKKKEIKGKLYTCECGKTLTKDKKSRHERSQKHIKYINSLI